MSLKKVKNKLITKKLITNRSTKFVSPKKTKFATTVFLSKDKRGNIAKNIISEKPKSSGKTNTHISLNLVPHNTSNLNSTRQVKVDKTGTKHISISKDVRLPKPKATKKINKVSTGLKVVGGIFGRLSKF